MPFLHAAQDFAVRDFKQGREHASFYPYRMIKKIWKGFYWDEF